jgi:hypothetical protein
MLHCIYDAMPAAGKLEDPRDVTQRVISLWEASRSGFSRESRHSYRQLKIDK